LEEDIGATASGWLSFLSGAPHCDPSCLALRIGSGNINTGSRVVSNGDKIFGGKFRDIERGPYADGTVTWEIPWDYSVNFTDWHRFLTVPQVATSTSTGRCTIKKNGSVLVTAELSDPDSEW